MGERRDTFETPLLLEVNKWNPWVNILESWKINLILQKGTDTWITEYILFKAYKKAQSSRSCSSIHFNVQKHTYFNYENTEMKDIKCLSVTLRLWLMMSQNTERGIRF
jgi:hypothetical protein